MTNKTRTQQAMDDSWTLHGNDKPYERFIFISACMGAMEKEMTDLVTKYHQRGEVFNAEIARLRHAANVPGRMHCIKCKFTLTRSILNAATGTVHQTPGNEPETCPNGCGPMWPVTWEQEARDCWAHIETLANELFPPTQETPNV